MATTERDIYTTTVDEDVQPTTNRCPECNGRVTTNAAETVCDDCGLVIDDQRIDHGPEWRSFDAKERDRTGAPLTEARHDRGLSTEIGYDVDAKGKCSRGGRAVRSRDSGENTSVGNTSRQPNGTSLTGWVKSGGS